MCARPPGSPFSTGSCPRGRAAACAPLTGDAGPAPPSPPAVLAGSGLHGRDRPGVLKMVAEEPGCVRVFLSRLCFYAAFPGTRFAGFHRHCWPRCNWAGESCKRHAGRLLRGETWVPWQFEELLRKFPFGKEEPGRQEEHAKHKFSFARVRPESCSSTWARFVSLCGKLRSRMQAPDLRQGMCGHGKRWGTGAHHLLRDEESSVAWLPTDGAAC